jgi:4-oxalocrotonate tautomerase
MPYVLIQWHVRGVTREQKAALIKEVTDLLAQNWTKPVQTFVISEEVCPDNSRIAGMTVSKYRYPEQTVETHAIG